MSRALPSRTTRLAGVTLALALGLSGCGSGLRAQTYQERATSDSTNEAVGAIAVRHIRVLPPQGGETYAAGSDARVGFVLVNEGARDDRLVSVTSPAAGGVDVVGLDGRPAALTVPGQGGPVSEFAFVLRGLNQELRTGQYIEMELTFAVNGAERMLVPVELTGTPGPRREGYHPVETDSEGNPLPEEDEGGLEGELEGEESGPELDNDGGDRGSGDQQVDVLQEPAGDGNGGDDAVETPPDN